jgi:hypothetical protein
VGKVPSTFLFLNLVREMLFTQGVEPRPGELSIYGNLTPGLYGFGGCPEGLQAFLPVNRQQALVYPWSAAGLYKPCASAVTVTGCQSIIFPSDKGFPETSRCGNRCAREQKESGVPLLKRRTPL